MSLKDTGQYYHAVLRRIPPRALPVFEDEGMPGKVLLAVNNGDATAERLVDHGVEVVALDYAECQKNGGGLHCSTLPLVRERN